MLKNSIFGAICVLTGAMRLSAAPAVNLELNPDARSFRFVLSNDLLDTQSTTKAFHCGEIQIVAAIGSQECDSTLATYTYNDTNRRIKNNETITNPAFGIDFISQTEKRLNRSSLKFCGEPIVTLKCSPIRSPIFKRTSKQ